ncbi:MAG: TadE/TadG family type IV pilus assembly protein [Microthrixaceae bacterium]
MIEAAIVLPVLMLFLLGIIEFGLVYATGATTTGASRTGARLAATAYAPAGSSGAAQRAAADQVAAAVTADLTNLSNAVPTGMVLYRVNPSATDGAPVGGFPGDNMAGGCTTDCFRYTWNGTRLVYSSGGWSSPDACGTSVDSVGVWVQARHDYLTRILGQFRYVDGRTSMRLEPLPTDQCTSP